MLFDHCHLQQMFYIGSLYYVTSTHSCISDKACSLRESWHKFPLQFSRFWDRRAVFWTATEPALWLLGLIKWCLIVTWTVVQVAWTVLSRKKPDFLYHGFILQRALWQLSRSGVWEATCGDGNWELVPESGLNYCVIRRTEKATAQPLRGWLLTLCETHNEINFEDQWNSLCYICVYDGAAFCRIFTMWKLAFELYFYDQTFSHGSK